MTLPVFDVGATVDDVIVDMVTVLEETKPLQFPWAVMTFVSKVTAAFSAYRPPMLTTPVVAVIEAYARTFPKKLV